ncbi:survival motor neuron protein-like isoform X2 [Bombus vosnesenskii]|uniref:Survival motor neuron protein-like isoform X2 n=1 Tax=Bombus vosnesenskii TaxID=207650 RepID=A0A6J3LCG7_9HYME|nr:survival motor neuron protein-like isoform X2 [Bombus vosnesenskii]
MLEILNRKKTYKILSSLNTQVNYTRNGSNGAPCRAIYSVDGEIYETIISKIYENNGTCVVKFVGYGNTEKVELSSLLESEGLQSQIAQQKKALEEKFNEENDEICETNFSTNVNSKKYNVEEMDCEHHFIPGPSFNSMTDIMPPAPPLPPQLMAKLLSWFETSKKQSREQEELLIISIFSITI